MLYRTSNCVQARACSWKRSTFRIDKGDKIGLVGRNGAGKTTMTKVLAGLTLPADGTVTRSGTIGYLPQARRWMT